MVAFECNFDAEKTWKAVESVATAGGVPQSALNDAVSASSSTQLQTPLPQSAPTTDTVIAPPQSHTQPSNSTSQVPSKSMSALSFVQEMFKGVHSSVLKAAWERTQPDVSACVERLLAVLRAAEPNRVYSAESETKAVGSGKLDTKSESSKSNEAQNVVDADASLALALHLQEVENAAHGHVDESKGPSGAWSAPGKRDGAFDIGEALDRRDAKRVWANELRRIARPPSTRGPRRVKGNKIVTNPAALSSSGLPPFGMSRWSFRTEEEWFSAPDLSTKLKRDSLKRDFPLVDAKTIDSVFQSSSRDYRTSLCLLQKRFPNPQGRKRVQQVCAQTNKATRGGTLSMPVSSDEASNGSHVAPMERNMTLKSYLIGMIEPTGNAAPMASARNAYASHRVEAQRLRDARDALYARVAREFNYSAPGASVVALSRVRRIRDAIVRADVEALRAIYRAHNAHLDNRKTVDLHGLHVEEAKKVLRILLTNACRIGRANFSVVTGAGRHSVGGPKIAPAVERSVRCMGHRCHWTGTGVLAVQLKRSLQRDPP